MTKPATLIALLRSGATIRLGDPRFSNVYKTASVARRLAAASERIVFRGGRCWLETTARSGNV